MKIRQLSADSQPLDLDTDIDAFLQKVLGRDMPAVIKFTVYPTTFPKSVIEKRKKFIYFGSERKAVRRMDVPKLTAHIDINYRNPRPIDLFLEDVMYLEEVTGGHSYGWYVTIDDLAVFKELDITPGVYSVETDDICRATVTFEGLLIETDEERRALYAIADRVNEPIAVAKDLYRTYHGYGDSTYVESNTPIIDIIKSWPRFDEWAVLEFYEQAKQTVAQYHYLNTSAGQKRHMNAKPSPQKGKRVYLLDMEQKTILRGVNAAEEDFSIPSSLKVEFSILSSKTDEDGQRIVLRCSAWVL